MCRALCPIMKTKLVIVILKNNKSDDLVRTEGHACVCVFTENKNGKKVRKVIHIN